MGAAADGWWRDPPAAVLRLLARLQRYRAATGETIVLVLDVPQKGLPEGDHEGVTVRYARRRGSDAADQRILELLDEGSDEGSFVPTGDVGETWAVQVVTSDRALADGARSRGASVTGAGAFLRRLGDAGC